MPDWSDNGEWLAHQHKLVEVGYRNRFEFLKHSVEFSKIIISGLIAINSGGLVALPAYSAFLFHSSKVLPIYLFLPAASFSLGVLFALLCSFYTYRNFLMWSVRALSEAREATNQAGKIRGHLLGDQDMIKFADEQIIKALKPASIEISKINASHVYSLFAAWMSLFLFIFGALCLAVEALAAL